MDATLGISEDKLSILKTIAEIYKSCLFYYSTENIFKFEQLVKTLDLALEGYKDEEYISAKESLDKKFNKIIDIDHNLRLVYYEKCFRELQKLMRRQALLPLLNKL